MKVLAFDTSTRFLSVACLEDETVKDLFHEDVGIRHSELLIPTIEKILKKLNWHIQDIKLICVGLGPGSFTGLRIALAAVKGFAAVLPVKVVGIPTMDAIARKVSLSYNNRLIAPLIDAHKGKVYTCIYKNSDKEIEKKSDYLLVVIDSFLNTLKEKTFFFGNAIEKYRKKLDKSPFAEYTLDVDWFPRAEVIGELGFKKALVETDDPESLEPLYLHPKECDINEAMTYGGQRPT